MEKPYLNARWLPTLRPNQLTWAVSYHIHHCFYYYYTANKLLLILLFHNSKSHIKYIKQIYLMCIGNILCVLAPEPTIRSSVEPLDATGSAGNAGVSLLSKMSDSNIHNTVMTLQSIRLLFTTKTQHKILFNSLLH